MQAYLEWQRPLAEVEGAEKPVPDAANAVACEDSSEGMPPKVTTLEEFKIDEAPWTGTVGGAGPDTDAYSAVRAALTV